MDGTCDEEMRYGAVGEDGVADDNIEDDDVRSDGDIKKEMRREAFPNALQEKT